MNLLLYFENRETTRRIVENICRDEKKGEGGGSAPSLVTVAIIIINIIN